MAERVRPLRVPRTRGPAMGAHYARADWQRAATSARCKTEVRVLGFTHMMRPLSGAWHKHHTRICLPRACYRASRTRDACVLTAAFAPWFCQSAHSSTNNKAFRPLKSRKARESGGDDGRGGTSRSPCHLGCCCPPPAVLSNTSSSSSSSAVVDAATVG
ncbi:hypothetical protein F5148DRAFT_1233370 [Russula earlei]|uniref:Uncharacterized protein n=1 Tax=Russula earlei TaxID=71964 RepID=A0ACC0TZL9_9AGAM|nr:hypothetical protein F5148DRAFT_1233370 [Russula earlei]